MPDRRKPQETQSQKNRVEDANEKAVMAFAIEQPAFGQVRVSNELQARYLRFSIGCPLSLVTP